MQVDHASKPQSSCSELLHHELVELIDWCRYVVNREPSTVSSGGRVSERDTEYQSISLDFPAVGDSPPVNAQISTGNHIRRSWLEAIGFRPPSAMEICCERGVAFLDLPSTLVWFDDAGRHVESLETEMPVGEQLLTQFHRSVTSLVRNISELDDVYRAAVILAAVRQSETEGRRVSLH